MNLLCSKARCTGEGLICLPHIVQVCGATHGLRVKRHDRVAEFVAKELEKKGFTVLREPRIPFRESVRKPDLLAYKGDQAWCMDVHICGDGRSGHADLSVPYAEKVKKYSLPELTLGMRRLSGATRVAFGAIVVSWRGCVSQQSMDLLRGLGLRKSLGKTLSLIAVEVSFAARVAYQYSA